MFGLTGIGAYIKIGVAIAFALLLAHDRRVDHLRGEWKAKHETLSAEAGAVLATIRTASNNPGLKWPEASGQVEAIAASRKEWKATSQLQSSRIDDLAMETARLKALSNQARTKAQIVIAKRETVIKRLESQILTPGQRMDCVSQLQEAEAALDLVYKEGL